MILVESSADLLLRIAALRDLRKGFITNFYPDDFKTNLWINKQELGFEEAADTIFIFHRKDGFTTLFYCSTTPKELSIALSSIDHKGMLVTDIITNDPSSPVLNVFYDHGFAQYSSLVRMSKMNQPDDSLYQPDKSIKNAEPEEIPEIMLLFGGYFDKYSEQIPVYEELERWVEQSHLIVYKTGSTIAGFLIYDLTGVTLYLRYWFVRPEFRDKKVGSELIREYYHRGKEAKRQIFWVIETNDNAIKRYEHYGFRKEKMYDCVLTKTTTES